jgi:hypothetical protein
MANDPFELFCLYYLGVTPEGDYQFANANQIAARLKCTVEHLMGTLHSHGLHPDTVLNTDFPLARYQVDIQLAAESGSREWLKEFAQRIYAEFRSHIGKSRDWLSEIEREKQEDQERGGN